MNKWYNYPKFKAQEVCRFCKHPAFWHMEIKNFGTEDQMGKWDKCTGPTSRQHCDCPGFGLVDNLEYLEQLSED